jgi:DNA-binding LacI/PurR family transcriptional regulator
MPTMTKSEMVVKHIKKRIFEGVWSKGVKLPPEQKIQTELGVSRTVMREAMSVLSSEGLIVRRKKAGTFVADEAGEQIIAILAPMQILSSKGGHFYQAIVTEAQKLAKASGYRAVLTIGHGPTTEEFCKSIHLFDEPVSKNVVGVIGIGAIDDYLRNKFEAAGKYYVCTDGLVSSPRENHVIASYEQMIKMAVEYLKAHGHFDFALMYPDSPTNEKVEPSEMRRIMVEEWVGKCQIDIKSDRYMPIPFNNGRASAYQMFKKLWSKADRPKAIIIADDIMCEITLQAIMDMGIKVPEELSIITQSNVGHNIPFAVPLTSIQFNPTEIINAAWHMLQNMIIANQPKQPSVHIYPKLIEGESIAYSSLKPDISRVSA